MVLRILKIFQPMKKEPDNETIHKDTPVQEEYCNIASTFSGIGNILLDINSVIHTALEIYSLDIEKCPYNTIYLHFQYLIQNLKKYQLKDIIYFYEMTGNPYFDLAIKTLDDGLFQSYSNLKDSIENKRIALILSCHKRRELNRFFSKTGLYVGMLDLLVFEVPFIYTLVSKPDSIIDPSLEYRCESITYESEEGSVGYIEESENYVSIERVTSLLNKEKIILNNDENLLDNEKNLLDNDKISLESNELSRDTANTSSSSKEKIFNTEISHPWSGEDLNLIMSGGDQEKTSLKHLANIRRSAMSLFDGKFHYSTIVRESTEKPKKVSGKMLKIIQENEERLRKEKEKTDNQWLRNFYMSYSKIPNLKGKRILLENTKINNEYINRKLLLLKIELYWDIWSLEMRSEEIDEKVLVPLYLACLEYIDKYVEKENFFKDELEFVIGKLVEAKFESTAFEILEKLEIKLNVQFSEGISSSPNDLDLYFQLKYAGDHLKRTLGTRKDKRVPFDPDQWQMKLLDAVDNNKSAIVAAPTSSGKTFICFYAIEKVLRSSDEDVVVFCLPTKALVNQVSADIYARFNIKNIKTALQGTLMPDRSNDPFNCQILITVPSMLESLLASKEYEHIKIRYIIIDEVHKINDGSLGIKIERIIHLARCPLLLLSATLGNLDNFYMWFKNIETSKGRDCELVYHSERYCELKPYVFSNTLVQLNGLFPYSFSHLKTFGFGNDLHFLPEELLNIYLYVYTILDAPQKKLIKKLAPKKFFKSNIITKADVKEYQYHLLGIIRDWINEGILGETQIEEIHGLLTKEAHEAFSTINDTSEEYIVDNIMTLLNTLKENDMLPVIVFNTDRDFVTRLARSVYERLENSDISKKKDKMMEKMKKEMKRTRDAEKTKDSWIDESIASEQMVEPEQRDIKYTFLDPITKLTDYDIKEEFTYIKGVPKDILDMAYRGIGIHHSAMDRKYRSAVEILFRKKHVRVLFATETLALGINMPCRTVVFAGDSLQLDPMNYKQMSGRAGRRGYDNLGNVVFFGIPKCRVQNLMVSMLPEIQGAYTYSHHSLISFNIEESLLKYPLLQNSIDNSEIINERMKNLSISASEGDNIFSTKSSSGSSKILSTKSSSESDKILSNTPGNDLSTSTSSESSKNMTLSILNSHPSRNSLVKYQKSIYSHIYPSNYLWDLFISNREFDPSIFIFGLLLEKKQIDWSPNEFMKLVAHLFEVKLCHSSFECVLPPLNPTVKSFITEINKAYIDDLKRLYSPELRSLQEKTDRPLFHLKSFLYNFEYPKNSYIYDFYLHGSSFKIRKYNHVLEGELWQSLNNIDGFLKSLIKLLEKLENEGSQDERLKKVKLIYEEFHTKFKMIFA